MVHTYMCPTRGSFFTALGVLCCFALFVCLTLLASFFLPSHLSFKNMYIPTYTCMVHLGYSLSVAGSSKSGYSLSSFHHEFRREKGSQTRRRREHRAADSSEQRETRLARRRVADRARFSMM